MSADLAGCVIIALGSNLGDSPRLIRQAMDRLQALSDHERDEFLRYVYW